MTTTQTKPTTRKNSPTNLEFQREFNRLLETLDRIGDMLDQFDGDKIKRLTDSQRESFETMLSNVGGTIETVLANPPFENSAKRFIYGPEYELASAMATVERLKAEGWKPDFETLAASA